MAAQSTTITNGTTTAPITLAVATRSMQVSGLLPGEGLRIEASHNGVRWSRCETGLNTAGTFINDDGVIAFVLPAGWQVRYTIVGATSATSVEVAVE